MPSTTAIALSGLNAAQVGMQVSAHHIANQETPGFRRQRLAQSAVPGGGVATDVVQEPATGGSEITDVVGLLRAKNAFLANLAVFRSADRMKGTLLDRAV